jgi:hypothetical protein
MGDGDRAAGRDGQIGRGWRQEATRTRTMQGWAGLWGEGVGETIEGARVRAF